MKAIKLPDSIHPVDQPGNAVFTLDFSSPKSDPEKAIEPIQWIYALVAPFPTLTDGVTFDDLIKSWKGVGVGDFKGLPILLDAGTLSTFQAVWGSPGDNAVRVVPEGNLLDEAWKNRSAWALVPFDQLQPRWKVLTVDGQTPLDKNFDPSTYPLTIHLALSGNPQLNTLLKSQGQIDLPSLIPATNRDPSKMTVLMMTGVTGLVRATAYRMELHGVDYPAQDILNWFHGADFVHISNEVSFASDCPFPNPSSASLLFCSRESYIGLLDAIGANIIELTGNHNVDWGAKPAENTLDLYHQRGWYTFGGGSSLQDAEKPALVAHHGNHLAFIGCNPVGPVEAWATDQQPGAAPCGDLDWMVAQVQSLKSAGYLPVVTFQYSENYTDTASYQQKADFRKMVDAGAIIVDGSQAHTPKEMEFYEDGFIHYGLGNLFFDQMEVEINNTTITTTRDEFLDRHVFYDGRYIGVDLLTARLEDYARPRPMTQVERKAFLASIFSASGW